MTPEALAALAAEQSAVRLDKAHVYWRNGKRVPGVTTVCKKLDAPQLDDWKVKVQVEGTARAAFDNPPVPFEPMEDYTARLVKIAAEQYEHARLADEAAVIGTELHALIEHHVREQMGQESFTPEASPEARFIFSGWLEWAAKVRFKPLAVESRVYHAEEDYCGTLDLLAVIDGRPAVVDWKSSKSVYESHRLQSAAYRKALESMGWPETDGYVVRVPRDGSDVSMTKLGPADDDWPAFKACLTLHRWVAALNREWAASKRAAKKSAEQAA